MDGEGDGHRHHLEFSPLLIGLLGILAGAMMVATYHCISAGCRYRRGIQNLQTNTQQERPIRPRNVNATARIFRRAPVVKYTKGGDEGVVCAVCLCEFTEGEDIRVLADCAHSFHVACIDMWLHSHSNCPLCRAETGQRPSHLALTMPESGGVALPQQEADNSTVPDHIGASTIVHYNL
ncbi:hypothetical protein HS088_TW03G01291 [Tripterygium wilfordii]|uniref:RING-type E3 ubiquitin transferase n=1 Tax=Tripterygium wilfordii TaxID=458696 RepID=A0A7J7DXG6_TRIWF|nr:hypothetical protein HS088_TW03G01291 [Tripterygium wilfordii]